MKEYLCVRDAAKLMGYEEDEIDAGRQYINDEIRRGNLKALKIGNENLIWRPAFYEWMRNPKRGTRRKRGRYHTARVILDYMRGHDLDFAGLFSVSPGDLWLDGPIKAAVAGIATGRFTAENYRTQWELIHQRAEWIISGDLSKAEIICLVADDSEAIMDEAARRDFLSAPDMEYIYDRLTLEQIRAFAARARGQQTDPSFPEGQKLEWAVRLGLLDAQKRLTPKGEIFFNGMG